MVLHKHKIDDIKLELFRYFYLHCDLFIHMIMLRKLYYKRTHAIMLYYIGSRKNYFLIFIIILFLDYFRSHNIFHCVVSICSLNE